MSFALSDHSLVGPVAETLAREVNGMPAKEAARLLGTSLPTITRIRRGEMPSAGVLLAAIKFFGVRILEPVIGKFDDASLVRRLDAIEGLLKEVRHARVQSAPPSLPRRDLDAHGGDGAIAQGLGRPEAVPVGAEGAAASLALIETARDGIPGAEGEALRRHLGALSNVVSLDAARALVKGDNLGRTGLAYKRPGEDWKALVAPENRLWTPSADPRPITDYSGNVVELRRYLDEAARSPAPLYVSHAGALLRDDSLIPFHSNVVRIPGRAKCGAALVLTDFVRVPA